jgi:two-component system phosphate regulon sensor histidine kinase PhoR
MKGLLEMAVIAVLGFGLIGLAMLLAIRPVLELLGVIRRIANGDYRPVILTGRSNFLRDASNNLRLIAEMLARQKILLAEEEFSLSMILESMTEGVIITGSDLKIRLVNKAAASMFNLKGVTEGLLLHEVFMSHELLGVAQRAVGTGEVQQGELTFGIPGRGERCHLVVTAAALKAPSMELPDGLLLVLYDVTRLRELEAVRREFVANVTHEFRTPLSVINGYLETLGEKGVSREMQRKSIAIMQRHGERLNRLIDDLLTISRMEERGLRLETAPTDIGRLLREVIQQLEGQIAERGAQVALKMPEVLPHVDVEGYRIEQAFSNLLANALRHGALTGGEITITAIREGPDLAIRFRDNGPGIPLQDQPHLFERFYRVGGDRARQTGGTGLGLSIVKNIVTAHGGRVTLESSPGEGSTFTIFLPVIFLHD